MPYLINPSQLDNFRKNQTALIILDASWHPKDMERDARQEFIDKHIIDANFFDMDAFNDPNQPFPHALIQDTAYINEKLGSFGIREDYKIIFYDNSHLHTACRAVWMMKVFGHNPNLLYLLDGGFKAWEKYGGKIESGNPVSGAKSYPSHSPSSFIRSLSQMKENVHSQKEQVIDVRHAVSFSGGGESYPGLRLGHIPNSISFPFASFFDKEGLWNPLDKIRLQLSNVCINLNEPIIATCGANMTAPILDFTLDILNHEHHAVYAGAWIEWGAETLYPGEQSIDERPIETCLEEC